VSASTRKKKRPSTTKKGIMPPHCRTLEEMRALKTPPAVPYPAVPYPPAVVYPPAVAYYPPPYPVVAYPPAVPYPVVPPEWCGCEHAPYVCAHHRALPHWCRVCTNKRLFPDMYAPPASCCPAPPASCCPVTTTTASVFARCPADLSDRPAPS
jgi:hypothetical protein